MNNRKLSNGSVTTKRKEFPEFEEEEKWEFPKKKKSKSRKKENEK